LGGGAAGSVYQGIGYPNEKHVAIKVLKPVGFKLLPTAQLRSCSAVCKGKPLSQEQIAGKANMTPENIWWLLHPTTKHLVAAYEDPLRNQLRELSLLKCIEIWGWTPMGDIDDDRSSQDNDDNRNIGPNTINDGGIMYNIPLVAPKYLKWLHSRRKMCREMSTMMRVGEHPNIIDLYEVLELIQDDKTTLFLVLELISGGELFDRIRAFKSGTPEAFARRYFTQLISGIEYCHRVGVCHRDLKPENLLLSDLSDSAILKIADFGLSELIFHAEEGSSLTITSTEIPKEGALDPKLPRAGSSSTVSAAGKTSPTYARSPELSLKRLRSVVGSPHYVAPEITTQGIKLKMIRT
jgi:serine/threonine protein kinase